MENIIGLQKIARNISDHKQARREGAHLAAIIDSSDDAIISRTLDGVVTSWNRAAEWMVGCTAGEAGT
jgi:PAS domain-containing protein